MNLIHLLLITSAAFINSEEVGNEEDLLKENLSEDESLDSEEYVTENGVFKLNGDNFDTFLEEKEFVLVEFYAPWCGHCKKLLPEYEKAAKELKDKKNGFLAKVDATEEKELAERFEVGGYPTLIGFRHGTQIPFDGSRDSIGVVSFMEKISSPSWVPPKEHTIVLTNSNFTEFVDKHELSIVMFYAPWCGHCKKLKPEYEKAAKELLSEDIYLAKVDATTESELGTKYGVSGYPTMKVFRKGQVFDFKSDARDQWGLMEYIRKLKQPASLLLSSVKEYKKYLASTESSSQVFFLSFFENEQSPLFDTYLKAANDLRGDLIFLHSFDPSVSSALKLPTNCLSVHTIDRHRSKHDPPTKFIDFKDDIKLEAITSFVQANSVPLIGEYNPSTENAYEKSRPLVLFFYTVDWSFEHRTATQLWRNKFASLAAKYKSFTFAIVDEEQNSKLFLDFGFDDSGEEINVGILAQGEKRYPMEPMEEYDEDVIKEFFSMFTKGKLKPHIKTQPKPAKQKGPVTIVVGKTFDQIVLDEKKDVLIELYAPWCGHCKNLEPIYKQLANKLKDEKDLVIAKMDATANDSPAEYSAEGFPTIYFAPANKKKAPIKFAGERDLKSIESFLRENAAVAFKGKKDEL